MSCVLKISGKSGKIVAILQPKEDKTNFMNFAKKKRLTTTNINESQGKNWFFVNNYLTEINKNLFYKIKLFAKEKSYKFM